MGIYSMTQRVLLQPSYILHYRSYRDTSLIVDVFSQDYGYISAIAQGARSARSHLKGLLQPFTPLLLSWSGKTELMRLNSVEADGLPHSLAGNHLISAIYLNELLLRVLHKYDPHPNLYQLYQLALSALSDAAQIQPVLRIFEKNLLDELGYAVTFDACAVTGAVVQAEKWYQFDPARGIKELTAEQAKVITRNVFVGSSLLALAKGEFTTPQQLRDAKQMMRTALAPVLGDKPLKSRELFLKS